ncbi:DUF1670 domain-containing protein [Syntrophothermus lipocalidus]|uniref:DUF1670 domain-containing protein n=1 Tax=Syntrophothermus lipocalidus (strain DSM 12680 / TGB-C1) TaxID=643648 RepID=D7CMI9_SYNLT|nr:DUF1670 domain-containing protein [Syntrophothermus lipocalidus]ADI01924.1 Protein of unknown function DUF1670 [Syntrophothermus lipocalidus DSM 12680]
MGRAKEYRQRLKYQVASARKKTLESMLAFRFVEELGMSETEARLLGYRTARWILNQPGVRGPNQILFDAVSGKDSFSRRHKTLKKIRLTPYDIEDLDLELEFGLSTMQAGRILRLIEEAYRQDALLSAKQLTMLCNITPTSLRSRLAGLRREGMWVPVAGLSRVDRERRGELRSAWALSRYLYGQPLAEVRQRAALSREAFRHLWSRFSHVARSILKGRFKQGDPEEEAWAAIVHTVPKKTLIPLLEEPEMPLIVTHVSARLSEDVSTRFRQLTPVIITVWKPEELDRQPDTVPGFLAQLKRRIVRVCFEAYRQNGLLTLMELQWIFQISAARISELIRSVQREHNLVVPTPGTILDAGRSMTHKDVIVGLHLQGYTVKDIARMTHHSPRVVDNYIGTFESVLILYLFGVPPELMARLLKRGISLINEHLKLVRERYRDHEEIKEYLASKGVKI